MYFKAISQEISTEQIKKHITFLASDELKGRGTSTPDEVKASEYIASEFKKLGLQAKGNDGYLYHFTFKKNPDPHDTSTVTLKERKARNVVGYIDNKASQTIIIGAHYDHLGLGEDGSSLDPKAEGKIHNGADDNASGTSGVIELARYYSQNKISEQYNMLFMAFSAEELGLIGSKKYCENPTIDFKNVNYMINMDMIGRLNDSTNKLMIYGVGTADEWIPLLDKYNNNVFSIKYDSSGIGPSDQTSFYLKNLPVLHFFTGQHSDYHKPTDDIDKINIAGEKKVLDYIIRIIAATEPLNKFNFKTTKSNEKDSPRFKVTLGIMPDYTFEGKGLKVDGVTEGKCGHRAGLLQYDVIVKLGDYEVKNVQDYMVALSKYSKGDTVKMKVTRKEIEQELTVTF